MLKGGTYLITGASGFLGGMLVRKLLGSDSFPSEKLKIIGIVRDTHRAEKSFKDINDSRLVLLEADVRDRDYLFSKVNQPVDYVIHCASVTQSEEMIKHPVETADSIVIGTCHILELAYLLHVKSMVFLSSMEVYGAVSDTGKGRSEAELGELSLTSARSSYSLGKRMAEHYCHIYQQEYGIPVKIARLAQIFGKGVRMDDRRVYMQFASAVRNGKDIILKTAGKSLGNYCASDEAIEAILIILNQGENGEVYNVVNEANTICIYDMAEMVINQIAGGQIGIKVEQENSLDTGYAPDTALRMSGEKLRKLGWRPVKGLVQMYKEVLEELKV